MQDAGREDHTVMTPFVESVQDRQIHRDREQVPGAQGLGWGLGSDC